MKTKEMKTENFDMNMEFNIKLNFDDMLSLYNLLSVADKLKYNEKELYSVDELKMLSEKLNSEMKRVKTEYDEREKRKTIKDFKTIDSAISYLDMKYGRDVWMNSGFVDLIKIGGIETTISYGLRMDPIDDKTYEKYKYYESRYKEFDVRLS